MYESGLGTVVTGSFIKIFFI